jgi:hypothetical protein
MRIEVITDRAVHQYVVDSTGQLVGQDGQGLALVGFFLHTGKELLALGIVAQKQDRCFGKGPREGGIPDRFP